MDADPRAHQEKFLKGIEEFNRQFFFECHETLEDLWRMERGPDRQFYQGLIQLATGFYHLSMRNFRGARSQLTKGMQKLESYRPRHRGVELQGLLANVQRFIDGLNRRVEGETVEFDVSQIPKIEIDPSAGL